MAKRHLSAIAISVISFSFLFGCQQAPPVASLYPAPCFDAPKMVARAPMTPNYIHSYAAIPLAVPYRAPAKLPPTAMAGIPAAWTPPVLSRPWRWIVIHHSATTTGGAVAFDRMHRAKGWDELGYDFVVGNGTDTANGQVEVGPRWTKQKIGAHAKSSDNRFNEFGIGICLVGNFDVERPTAKQLQSLEKLVAYMSVTYHISPDHIIGHNDTKSTDCPGKYLRVDTIRRQVALMTGRSTLVKNTGGANTELLTKVAASR